MKNTKSIYWIPVLAIAALSIGSLPIIADDDEKEETVTLKQLPEAVQKTIERESVGGKVAKIEKENKRGRIVYEADIMIDGKEYEAKIAPNGTLIVKKLERKEHGRKHKEEMEEHHGKKKETKIDVKDVPANVMEAINKAVPGGKVKEAEKEMYGKKLIYEVEKIVDGKEVEIKATPQGKIIKVERDDDDDDGDDGDDDDD